MAKAQMCRVAFLVVLLFSMHAYGRDRNTPQEHQIELQLERVSADSVEIFKEATAALDQSDYAKASQLYTLVLAKAPGFDPALRRLGTALIELGQREKGLRFIAEALTHERSPENLISMAYALAFSSKGTTVDGDRKSALLIAKEAFLLSGDFDALLIHADMAMQLGDRSEFSDAVRLCKAKFPEQSATHYFSAIKAADEEEWVLAENEIRRAGELGMSASVVDDFLASGVHRHVLIHRCTLFALFLLIAWILGLLLIYISGKIMSARTMQGIRNADPNEIRTRLGASFKRVYRALINFAGTYYYVSLPFLVVLLLAIAIGLFYAFLMLGRIPIKLMVILAILTVTTIYQMIRTLFIRQKTGDPGRELKPEEAPGLCRLLGQVAEKLGTRPIDQIRITMGTDLAVYEKGSRRERMQDKAQRLLILGVGVLDGFRLNAFRAVIAHEYGHFSNRDTAGGDVAIRVNADIFNFAMAIAIRGLAVWYNAGFQFLRLYQFLFRRISHGASRLQEVMADIEAVTHYGALQFEEGLRHAILRGVQFDAAANRIGRDESLRTYAGLRSLYEPVPSQVEDEKPIEAELQKAISHPTSEDDTHPSPVDRFALARRIQSSPQLEEDGWVWDLFADREGLTQEMVRLVGSRLGLPESQPTD
ncbi:MAG TPA: M48 family metalloprotease [Acidobacteriota bacterium]|nr:M48 family metalloprotease [Acidobacteriota bacterium]